MKSIKLSSFPVTVAIGAAIALTAGLSGLPAWVGFGLAMLWYAGREVVVYRASLGEEPTP